jgi:hypothetical protein
MATTTNDKFQLNETQLNDLVTATDQSKKEIHESIGESIGSLSTFVMKLDCE